MRVAILAVSILFISTMAHGEQSGLCEDLAKFTCSPGKQDDGTGSAEKKTIQGDAASAAFDSKRPFVESKMRAIFEDANNAYLRKLGLGAVGLNDSPQCNSKDASEITKCKNDLIEGMISLARQKLTGVTFGAPYATANTLEEKSLVLENDQFAKALTEIEQEISGKVDYRAKEQVIKDDLFPKVKKKLASKIASIPMDDKKKQFMLDKINGITYGGNNCEEIGAGLNKMFIANAYYHPTKNTFKVCKGLLSKDISEFHLAFVIGHELAHSIDPCNVAVGPASEVVKYTATADVSTMDEEYPIASFLGCLRSPKSVVASSAIVNGYPPYGGQPGASYNTNFSNVAINQPQPHDYCTGDQIGESTSDWFGIEIAADLMEERHPKLTKEQWQKGFSNIFRPLCQDEEAGGFFGGIMGTHPKTSDRVNSIILTNPKVRAKMGCEKPNSRKVYCDATNPTQLAAIIAETNPKPKPASGAGEIKVEPSKGKTNSFPGSNGNQDQRGVK